MKSQPLYQGRGQGQGLRVQSKSFIIEAKAKAKDFIVETEAKAKATMLCP